MPKYRVRFREGGRDEFIEGTSFSEMEGSYVFFDGDDNIVARFPTDVVQSVVEEKADAG